MKINLLQSSKLKSPLSKKELLWAYERFAKVTRGERAWIGFFETFMSEPEAVNLKIVDDEEMRDIYQNFKGRRKTTDVLSFPSLDIPNLEFFDEDISLGDIVISLPAVQRGARRGGRSLREEFLEVYLHSLLHLLGLDHVVGKNVTVKQAAHMRKIQEDLFRKCRSLIKRKWPNYRAIREI